MSTEQPCVSVIIPCFNYGHFVGETLDCVRAQTLTNWECLVVDDGSTDGTRHVAEQYAAEDSRIRYIFQPNAGHSAARNTGLRRAQGHYIQFLDADDAIQSRKLEMQAAYLETHAEIEIVYGEHRYFTTETRQQALEAAVNLSQTPGGPESDILLRLMQRNIMVIHAPLFRRRLFDTVGPLDTALAAAEDWDFWLRCALSGARFHFQNWNQSQALVRHHSASYSHNRRRMLEAILELRTKIGRLTDDPLLLAINHRKRWEEEAALGKYEGIYGDWSRGARLLMQAGVSAHSPRWLLYALLLPLLRLRLVRSIPRIQRALRTFE